jgi:hypothetical protein
MSPLAEPMRAPLIVASLLLVACAQPPTARLAVRRLAGPRPAQAVARCLVAGLGRSVTYHWKLSPGLRPVGWSPPSDEAAILVTVGDVAPVGGAWAECTATSADGRSARVTGSLLAPRILSAPASLRAVGSPLITVSGSGFGPARGDGGDGLYFASAAGQVVAADHSCRGAAWADGTVSACVPASLPAGRWQLRVQSGDELALSAAPLTLVRGP